MTTGSNQPGTLFVVATPIGNLADLSDRAVATLRRADVVAAEDTRHTGKLLSKLEISTNLLSYHEFNEAKRSEELLAVLLSGDEVAMVSDAGTPCVSDPGSRLVSRAHERGIKVVPIPGPSAVTTAVSASGFAADSYHFAGYIPPKSRERQCFVERWKTSPCTVVVFETPHRIVESLEVLADRLRDRPLCMARELTKLHEEIIVATAEELLELVRDRRQGGDSAASRGEYVLVICGMSEAEQRGFAADPAAVGLEPVRNAVSDVSALVDRGLSTRDAVRAVAFMSEVSKNDLYDAVIDQERST